MNTTKYQCAIFLLLSVFLTACERKQPQVEEKKLNLEASALEIYSDNLVTANTSKLLSHSSAIKVMVSPLSYLTDFSTGSFAMLTTQNEGDIGKNSNVTEQWQKMYCTNELKQIMQQAGIAISSARIIALDGKAHSTAICVAEQSKLPPPMTGVAPPDTGSFSLIQICKAGISVMLGRETSIMTGKANGDQAQIQYVRPNDGRPVSYRCRLDGGYILTWDDSIAGARWYGSEQGDTKLAYRITERDIIVSDVIRGKISNEKSFSLSEL